MKAKYLSVIALLVAIGGCSSPAPTVSQTNLSTNFADRPGLSENLVEPRRPSTPPNFAESENWTYHYVTAVSDEDREKGRALGDIVSYQYRGMRNGRHVLASVDDDGAVLGESECSDPCRIITSRHGRRTRRLPYDNGSVIGSAFEDAMNGHLQVRGARRDDPRLQSASATIPAIFVGEWNEDPSHCGTGLGDTRLRIEPRVARFYESDAQVTGVTVHNSRSVTVEASSAGEGEVWNDSFTMVLSRSNNELTIDGLTRQRCPR